MNPMLLFLVVAGILVVAMVMRSGGHKDETASSSEDEGGGGSVLDDLDDADADHEHQSVPITAEGVALLQDGHELRLISMIDSEEEVPDNLQTAMDASAIPYSVLNRMYMPAAPRGGAGSKPGTPLNKGDFTAARLRPGVAGSYAWRVETLGRDGDFGFFPFTTRTGADAALALLETHGIVSQSVDEDGEPNRPSNEDFEEARRRYEETESSLAIDVDDDALGHPGEWSDRR